MFKLKQLALRPADKVVNKNMFVMVCEDNLVEKKLLVKTLHNLGFSNISIFAYTTDLHNYLQQVNYSIPENTVILMDIMMPYGHISGIDLCKILNDKINPKCSIVAVTGLKERTFNTQTMLENGFDDILFKPYSRKQLIDVINKANGKLQ